MLIRSELWSMPAPLNQPSIIAVTTNSVVTSAGLIMGRGSAGEARDRIPGIRQEAAQALRAAYPNYRFDGSAEFYGFLVVREPKPGLTVGFGLIQAKYHWRDVAPLDLVLRSIESLGVFAKAHPDVTIRCPVPGIGAGQVGQGKAADPRIIEAYCRDSPDNVIFVHR